MMVLRLPYLLRGVEMYMGAKGPPKPKMIRLWLDYDLDKSPVDFASVNEDGINLNDGFNSHDVNEVEWFALTIQYLWTR